MVKIEFTDFFNFGNVFGFTEKTTETEIISKLGQPVEVEDYGPNGKYLHYDTLRFSINKHVLRFVDIFFMNTDNDFGVEFKDEVLSINKWTTVLDVLHYLNQCGIKWEISYGNSFLDYLVIETEKKIYIYFYYENKCIERISKTYMTSEKT
jgi:hypothetical protein